TCWPPWPSWRGSPQRSSTQAHIRRPRADIEKMDDVQRLRVEDESARVFPGRQTQLRRACHHEWCERRRGFKQRFGMLIRQFAGIARQFDRWPGRRRQMDVEEQ